MLCRSDDELRSAFESVKRLGKNNFSNDGTFLEKYVHPARHVEVQIFGNGSTVVALGDRDCSAQRRNQKVVEETPAPGLSDVVRAAMAAAATSLAQSVKYESAGTVEFIYDPNSGAFYFLEVNTRLQVEHGVTECVTGVDLVEWMVRHAAGEDVPVDDYVHVARGHAIQARIYAEDPARDFQPCSGLLTQVEFPTDVRVDTWVEAGVEVSPFYDPMLAKVIVHGGDRAQALAQLEVALQQTRIAGIVTNVEYLLALVRDDVLKQGKLFTRYLSEVSYAQSGVEVLLPGTQSTVQDYPGRTGYWDVGIPPSGPMDSVSLRLANRAVGNPETAAGLELTMHGPTLQFRSAATVAWGGADMAARVEKPSGETYVVADYTPIDVEVGDILRMGRIQGPGARTYLALRGGLAVPHYLGSRATFTLGGFGGHGGRALRAGDVLPVGALSESLLDEPNTLPRDLPPVLVNTWQVRVLYGPHGAPDFFTDEDIQALFSHPYQVHYNSARTGVRLIGPKPNWARTDGGEAGLHPSNIHDNAYAIGAIDFTGDMPILLGPDGPSLGGFVCPAVVIAADLWKLGQLAPGDTIHFVSVNEADAQVARSEQDMAILARAGKAEYPIHAAPFEGAVRAALPATEQRPRVVYRRSGQDNLLVEYGPLELDLNLRFRAHALMNWLKEQNVPGIIELTPGIRSLQVHFDSRVLSDSALTERLQAAESELGDGKELVVPSRIVHLPLSWDDPQTQLAAQKYQQLVRRDAPWCPDNIEFIRRINGLASAQDVKRIVFDTSYMVLGLGDVYLGAPVATPIDPRHRLVTTKYNPARTWTPENAVGIGGAYMCIYGMEGPGGYQFVGRTLQVYNRFRVTQDFAPNKPWLLRFFDQIRFYPVEADELLELRADFAAGRHQLRVEQSKFRLADYNMFLRNNRDSIHAFKATQQAAFEAERLRWLENGQLNLTADVASAPDDTPRELPAGHEFTLSQVPGSVWKIHVEPGTVVSRGQALAVVESMKMEISIEASRPGVVTKILCQEGTAVSAGDALFVLKILESS
jgi:urea carboxylase